MRRWIVRSHLDSNQHQGFDAVLMRNLKVISARATDAGQDGMEAYSVYELEVV